ncbi:hypothetical protein KJ657_00020 [Patescibacteria group bacterium]|nr:hypothetical protein [Nanoarchaeota archaeon]MBU1015463.1 hypothetical protein [Patescibacteria group bacterium]MBU1938298.1 hypothetical protein [Patescibacteria group bacterium]
MTEKDFENMSPERQRNIEVFRLMQWELDELVHFRSQLRVLLNDESVVGTSEKRARIERSIMDLAQSLVITVRMLLTSPIEAGKMNLNELDQRHLQEGRLTDHAIARLKIYFDNFLFRTTGTV